MGHTELKLARPDCLGRVGDEPSCEVALHAANHVVVWGVAALADDAEGVVFHYGCAADAAKETLLHAALEADDCYFGGRLLRY